MNVTDSAVRRAYALGQPSGYGRSAEEGALARVAAENEFDDWLAEHDAALVARAEAAEAVIVAVGRAVKSRYPANEPSDWTDFARTLAYALDPIRAALTPAVSRPEPTANATEESR